MGSAWTTANCFAAIRVVDEHFRAQISLAGIFGEHFSTRDFAY
jgi:hypothetical protein